jgi:flagellar hook-associated protein 1 FlgK
MTSHALRMFQRALDTTGHNIANVNTAGYSRQTVEFKTQVPIPFYSNKWHSLGQGVALSAIVRARDGYLEQSARNNASTMGKFSTLATALKGIEAMYNEPGESGIAVALDRFFDSWSALGSNPGDSASRIQVQNAGVLLTSRVRNAYGQMVGLEGHLTTEADAAVARINQLGANIADLNLQIKRYTNSGGSPNDMLDQRDAAVRELSSLIDTHVERFEDGSYAVYVAGHTLVDQAGARPMPTTYDPVTSSFVASGVTYTVKSGALSGLFQSMASVTAQKSQLDALANELRTQFNTLHQTGIDQDGNTGNMFFNDALPQTGAIDFNLSAAVLASPRAIAAGVTGEPGDGGLALSLSQLRDTQLAALGNRTFQGYYLDNVGQLGSQAAYYEAAVATEQAVGEQIENQVQAVSGVSLDDEMAEMMRYQRSYQAAARALTVFDQVTEDLIEMLRR